MPAQHELQPPSELPAMPQINTPSQLSHIDEEPDLGNTINLSPKSIFASSSEGIDPSES